ncbi:MAG: hypothetical protein HC806_01810 [Anaerolineae bacterium]|nr:hypothetical protein [Anaerolineae bacterium]
MKNKIFLSISLLVLLFVQVACTPVEGVLEVQIEPAAQVQGEENPLNDAKAIAKLLLGIDGNFLPLEKIQYLTAPCTTADGLGGPPKCAEGQADGTLIEVFPVGGPEGSYATADNIESVLASMTLKRLYAVYEIPSDTYTDEYCPIGQYALLFERELNDIPMPITAHVRDGKLVRLDFHFGVSEEDELQSIPVELVLIPPAGVEAWLGTTGQ